MGKEIQKVNAERQRQRYNKEFKLATVKLLQSGTKPGTLIAMELGIQRNLLYKWAETLKRHDAIRKLSSKVRDVTIWGNTTIRSRQRMPVSSASWLASPKSATF